MRIRKRTNSAHVVVESATAGRSTKRDAWEQFADGAHYLSQPSSAPEVTRSMIVLKLERELRADPSRVWRAFTEPGELSAWLWPPRFGTTAELDVRVGGRYQIAAPQAPVPNFVVSGTYLEVGEPHRLALTWQWHGEEAETTVQIDLTAAAGTTRLRLRHFGFDDAEAQLQHTQGWTDCLIRLADHVAKARLVRPPMP